ncbi:MAG: Adenine-specific DNA methylase containing a Zn-ribbon [Candidatus Bipolaricaulis sibiricus]|uniref:Adenine-specific DNA methylase containing a Zn-ribbon n=1 Tax=Bipolaricaulis sibiricus TaxID=2501609 RepID=A0A410FUR5_BIPS1|nr:MAG: Adenine-specific DNA methylase containing a Zn-ribbon [Candidatus Bipolaricaulis sibiricus]
MIPKNCKRLAEVDFPLSAVNDACVEENNRKTRVDSGHISLLHAWWARRPLASCRSLLLTLLLPDPCDPLCPAEFKAAARKALQQHRKVGLKDADLQKALLAFVADIANWDIVRVAGYVSTARELVKAAHGAIPHVLDPFSGGGSIPLEAQRLGCEVTASDVNPVAWLLLKIALEWCGRKGPELADLFEEWAEWTLKEAEKRLAEYYPADAQRRKPLAYLWARTVRCEAAGCGARIPLVRNLVLSTSKGRKKALRIVYPKGSLEPRIEVFAPVSDREVERGTVAGNNATCLKCHMVTPRERVQAQLREKHGGADDAILLAVVRGNTSGRGKDYEPPNRQDMEAFSKAATKSKSIKIEMPPAPPEGDTGFRPRPYGITNWADVLAPRQRFSRWVLHEVIEDALKEAAKKTKDKDLLDALAACLYAAYSDNGQYHTSLCVWLSEGVTSIFIQGSGVPMRADFVEGNPLSPNCEGLGYSIRSVQSTLRNLSAVRYQPSSPLLANVLDAVLPEESVDVVFTDPPYANQIPYAHLSDFFYGWLRLGMRSRLPQAFTDPETEKARELTENRAVKDGGVHDRQWYESHMYEAFAQMKRVIREDGVASVVFAHKDTDRWEALISALVQAGWRTTGSWPIATERRQRMRGQGYAALETSVHLVCRPRPDDAPVGDWGEVLRELPKRVGDWMERLQGEGIRGADLVFACIGPALEIFSRYAKVETADGREVKLAEFLEKVWEVVGRAALEQVLSTAEAKARNGAAGALEEDARLTALFLWTLQSTNGQNGPGGKSDEEAEDGAGGDEDEEEAAPRGKAKGYSLVFDVVRRFAQPLGIELPKWEGRIIETQKGIVRLLAVKERAEQLFGEDGAEAVAHQLERDPMQDLQQVLFPELLSERPPKIRGRKQGRIVSAGNSADPELKKDREATTLDRVHAAMLLQAGGQSNALRALLKAEQERGPDFLRLANALSALYPKGSEEKRLLDAMLLAVPR